MVDIGQFLTSSFAESLGWTVVHSLWQATVLVLLYSLFSPHGLFRKINRKYMLAFGILSVQLLLSIFTFWYYFHPEFINNIPQIHESITTVDGQFLTNNNEQNILDQIQSSLSSFMPVIVSFWILGMLFFTLKLAVGYTFWHRLRTKNLNPVPEQWREVFENLKSRMSIGGNIGIFISSTINSPMLIGQLKPIILLPTALVNRLSIEQVEMILAHELAHLQRFDYILNWVQLFMESIFYYHPAIWWLGKEIRFLREQCADEVAINYTNNSIVYAKTLLTVAEQNHHQANALLLGLLGENKQNLLIRIQRILQQPLKQPNMKEKFVVSSILLLMAVFISFGTAWSSPDVEPNINENPIEIRIDSLPHGQIKIAIDEDGETLNASLKDGNIEKLNVNGKEIPPNEFPDYEDRVSKIFEEMPPPPPPPPAPPPPAPGVIESPPPPPAPPALGKTSYRTTKEIHKIDDGGEEIEIIIEEETNGNVRRIIVEKEERDGEDMEELTERMVQREIEIAERLAERKVEMAERRIEIETRMEEQKEKIERRIERISEERAYRDQWLKKELLEDGLIQDPKNYTLKLNNKRLKVNGKTAVDALHQKYMELYEMQQGIDFSTNTSINVQEKSN